MDTKKSKKLLAMLAGVYWALVLLVYLVAGEQFRQTRVTGDMLSPSAAIGEIVDGMTVTQRLRQWTSISELLPATICCLGSAMKAATNESDIP